MKMLKINKLYLGTILTALLITLTCTNSLGSKSYFDYLLLATKKTSTMEKEITEASDSGYRFVAVMGGETLGGNEVVVVMQRSAENKGMGRYQYKLLATSKTSTMEKELQAAGKEGFAYCGQTVFSSTFGGDEVVVILERDRDSDSPGNFEYSLLGTKKTSTMQKELHDAGVNGFELVGLTVGKTSFGGSELISILRKRVDD